MVSHFIKTGPFNAEDIPKTRAPNLLIKHVSGKMENLRDSVSYTILLAPLNTKAHGKTEDLTEMENYTMITGIFTMKVSGQKDARVERDHCTIKMKTLFTTAFGSAGS
jgi:hypothetical protein